MAVAVALADAEGLDAVTMRAVAAELGTGAGSLYRYLTGRDDLLDLMSDAVVAELRPFVPPAGDWLDAMLETGRRQLALHRRHPWLLDLTPRPTGVGPESLAWFDACLAVLEPLTCPARAKLEAVALMIGVVTLVARSEVGPQTSPFGALDLGPYPHLVAALTRAAGASVDDGADGSDDLFGRTLRVLLTGLLVDPSDNERARS